MAVRYAYDNTGALATVTKGGVTWTNTYNADGIRTKRTNGTNTYSYIYNADAFASTGQGLLGNNMFAYCLNNPVNGCDFCGKCFHRWDFWNDCELFIHLYNKG